MSDTSAISNFSHFDGQYLKKRSCQPPSYPQLSTSGEHHFAPILCEMTESNGFLGGSQRFLYFRNV